MAFCKCRTAPSVNSTFKMPRQFSDDLRWRMIFQRIFYRRMYDEIATQLFVSSKTVYRTCTTFFNTGDVKPCCFGRPTGSVTLFLHEEYIIMDSILQTPQIQLNVIADHIINSTGSVFSAETLCKAVYRLGITRKKVSNALIFITRDKLHFRSMNIN